MRTFLILITLFLAPMTGQAQGFSALARVEPGSTVQDRSDGIEVVLQLSQPVPYRVYHLAEPFRLVLEFSEVEWSPISHGSLDQSAKVTAVRSGPVRPGWSRLVLTVDRPMLLENAQVDKRSDLGATATFTFAETDSTAFLAKAGIPNDLQQELKPQPVPEIPQRRAPGAPLRVVLDPGHGGIDPGASSEKVTEAGLMLVFARELQDVLNRAEGFEVVLTRQEDVFVPLETRVTAAKEAGADVFLSLHADVVLEGQASGVAIYTLSEEASDIASEKLAERHDRDDLLSGVDLTAQDDTVAFVLMDIARHETAFRTNKLADALINALGEKVELYKNPRLEAGFSVLKSPDIPSVLIELGFMSSKHDLEKLQDPEWRARAAEAIKNGLQIWADEDVANAELRRQ
jgi:N-acetylmuramoyl-L-alanine amidase